VTLAFIFFVCSCGYNNSDPTQEHETPIPDLITPENHNEVSSRVIPTDQLSIVDIPSASNVRFFDKDNIIYSLAPEGSEQMYNLLYKYDINTGETKQLAKVSFPSMSTGSVVVHENNLYVIGASQDYECEVLKIDMETCAYQVISQSHSFYSYITQLGDNIILFTVTEENDATIYRIDSINLLDLKSRNIVEKKYENDTGYCITCIDTDSTYIYAYEVMIGKYDTSDQIVTYTNEGQVIAEYLLDLSEFISIENNLSTDSVFTLKKINNYFILNTINGRVCIMMLDGDNVYPKQIPDNLYKEIPSGYHLLKNGFTGNNVYIASNGNDPKIYIFNAGSGEFVGLSFLEDFWYICTKSYDDQILIRQESIDGINKFYILQVLPA